MRYFIIKKLLNKKGKKDRFIEPFFFLAQSRYYCNRYANYFSTIYLWGPVKKQLKSKVFPELCTNKIIPFYISFSKFFWVCDYGFFSFFFSVFLFIFGRWSMVKEEGARRTNKSFGSAGEPHEGISWPPFKCPFYL